MTAVWGLGPALIVAVVASVWLLNDLGRLRAQMGELRARLWATERQLECATQDLLIARSVTEAVSAVGPPDLAPRIGEAIPVRHPQDVLILQQYLAENAPARHRPDPKWLARPDTRVHDLATAQDEAFRMDADRDTEKFFDGLSVG